MSGPASSACCAAAGAPFASSRIGRGPIWIATGDHLVLEIKGQNGPQESAKRHFLAEWVDAVNAHGGFGHWRWAVSLPGGLDEIPAGV